MNPEKYPNIRVTPTFLADYATLRTRLREHSPLAFIALPRAMFTILETIHRYPRSWPIRRKSLGDTELEFHLAVVNIAHRRLHVRYWVDDLINCHLMTAWVDGDDEPTYVT